MKVQWQLIDSEGKKYALLGKPFDLIPELIKNKWKNLWKGINEKEPIKILVKDFRTDELKADQIYDVEGKLSELLDKENNDNGQKKTSYKDSKD